ncbi:VUT family protein [Aneurinibacillus migulanus]|uniref:VUT family protein n=1 Tax=Aneurinibacillus migulanus TaxID=47500 RepID=UPI00209FAC33|nr:VUT family protein [Aneurinibacillus migulanus]MCP1355062.1 VUT family protein [Aneurinibacillus migulanus]
MRMILYILSILAANVITASIQPVAFGSFIVPAGTFLIGVTFILRDMVQNSIGKKRTYGVIIIALILSAITSYILGDTLYIVLASALSFVFSEASDTEIYSRLKGTIVKRVAVSGLIGGTLDSCIFVIVGLSPIGLDFIPWEAVPSAIFSQMIVKGILQIAGASLLNIQKFKRVFQEEAI